MLSNVPAEASKLLERGARHDKDAASDVAARSANASLSAIAAAYGHNSLLSVRPAAVHASEERCLSVWCAILRQGRLDGSIQWCSAHYPPHSSSYNASTPHYRNHALLTHTCSGTASRRSPSSNTPACRPLALFRLNSWRCASGAASVVGAGSGCTRHQRVVRCFIEATLEHS